MKKSITCLMQYNISNMHVWSSSASPACVRYLHRYRLIGRHAVTGLPKHHVRDGDIALRLVVQLQDRHLPSVVGHIKVVVCHPVLNKLCMHGSPAPLQRSIDKSIMITIRIVVIIIMIIIMITSSIIILIITTIIIIEPLSSS